MILPLNPENHQARSWPKRKTFTSPMSGSPVQANFSHPGGRDLKAFLLAGRVFYIPFWWQVSRSLIFTNWLVSTMSFCFLRCVVTWEVNVSFHTDTMVTRDSLPARFAQVIKLPSHGLSCTQLTNQNDCGSVLHSSPFIRSMLIATHCHPESHPTIPSCPTQSQTEAASMLAVSGFSCLKITPCVA